MIDAATAELIRNKISVPVSMTEGEIEADRILYEMEEDRFFLEFPDVASTSLHRKTFRTDAGIYEMADGSNSHFWNSIPASPYANAIKPEPERHKFLLEEGVLA